MCRMLFARRSRRPPFSAVAILLWGLLINVQAADLPDMGVYGAATVTQEEERLLGQQFMRQVRNQLQLLDDPLSLAYIQHLGDRIASQLDSDQPYRFFIVQDPGINAFAGPDGYIGVNTGLMLTAQGESELASVLAHEIAHVAQRHLMRSFESGKQQGLLTLAAMIAAAVLAGTGGSGEASEAVIASAVGAGAQQQLQFSRAHEQEADRLGITLLAKADYDPRSMPLFFERMSKEERLYSKVPEFLLTHPLTASRIADAQSRAAAYPARLGPANDVDFWLMQQRIAHLAEHPREVPAVKDNDIVQTYTQALREQRAKQYDTARKDYAALISKDEKRLIYYLSLAELEVADKNPAAALQQLDRGLALYPENDALSRLKAKLLLDSGKADQARLLLGSRLRNPAPDPELYRLLAIAANDSQHPGEAYEAQAEYHYRRGEADTAIDQMRRALTYSDDSYSRLRRQARLDVMEEAALRSREASSGQQSQRYLP